LKKGGKAILQVPISKILKRTFEDNNIQTDRQREVAFGQSDHVRIYGQDYIDRLSLSGFSVQRCNISKEYQEYGVNLEEDIFVVKK
jgi:hypothetical protein